MQPQNHWASHWDDNYIYIRIFMTEMWRNLYKIIPRMNWSNAVGYRKCLFKSLFLEILYVAESRRALIFSTEFQNVFVKTDYKWNFLFLFHSSPKAICLSKLVRTKQLPFIVGWLIVIASYQDLVGHFFDR